jgi:hypothetical protein
MSHKCLKTVTTQWCKNLNTFGTYTFIKVNGRPQARDTLRSDRLYLAGEHTSRDYSATLHGAWFTGECAAAQIVTARKQLRTEKPILVVGSGMAGLACADALRKATMPVVVLESSDHTGGRAWTNTSTSSMGALHMGGSWCHGAPKNHPAVMRGVTAKRTDWEDMVTYVLDRGLDAETDVDVVDRVFDRLLISLDSEMKDVDDMPMEHALHSMFDKLIADKDDVAHTLTRTQRAVVRQGIRSHIGGLFSAPPFTLSAKYGDEEYQLEKSDEDHLLTSPLRW